MSIGWIQIAVVALLVVLLFGRGKIKDLMGELGQGIKSFRKGLDVKDAEVVESKDKKQDN